MATLRYFVVVLPKEKVLLLERDPHAPGERLLCANDWYVNATVNEEKPIGDHATVGGQKNVGFTSIRRHVPELGGTIRVVCGKLVMRFPTAIAKKLR